MSKIFLYLLGIIFSSIGLSFIILYLNLLTIGYKFVEYLEFIFTHRTTLLFFIGILLLIFCFKRK